MIIHEVESEPPIEPRLQRLLEQFYPRAERARPEFEVPPVGAYPKSALKDKRQMQFTVLAIVMEDGSVELAQSSFDDPQFGPPVRAALAGSRATPVMVDGVPRVSWSLLDFTFEFVGAQ